MQLTLKFLLVLTPLSSLSQVFLARADGLSSAFLVTTPAVGPDRINGVMSFVIILIATTALLTVVAKVIDFRRRKEEEKVRIELQ